MEHIGEAQTETERERQVSKQWQGGHAGTAEWVQGSGQLPGQWWPAPATSEASQLLKRIWFFSAKRWHGGGLQRLRGTQGRCQF